MAQYIAQFRSFVFSYCTDVFTWYTGSYIRKEPPWIFGVGTFVEQLASIAQRFAKTSEVADSVVFVASEKAAMINGAALRVNGGTAKVVF